MFVCILLGFGCFLFFVFVILNAEPRASFVQGKHSTPEPLDVLLRKTHVSPGLPLTFWSSCSTKNDLLSQLRPH